MHSTGSGLLVNAEVDSMAAVVDGVMGIGVKTSPHQSEIENAEARLRKATDQYNETIKELRFLLQGGNPLDFKTANMAAVSVQSTSLTYQRLDQIVTSEGKYSFTFSGSPNGDSVESSGRPGGSAVFETNSADNLIILSGEGDKSSLHHANSISNTCTGNDDKEGNLVGHSTSNTCTCKPLGSVNISVSELPESNMSGRDSAAPAGLQSHRVSFPKVADKDHTDLILKEAQMIKAKRKRIAQLSTGTLPMESRRKSHWDFVLEEMAWMANDFAQERLWKVTAASKLCQEVAVASCSRFEEQCHHRNLKNVAHTLTKAIMEFWCTTELHLNRDDLRIGEQIYKNDMVMSKRFDGNKFPGEKIRESDMLPEVSNESQQNCQRKKCAFPVQGYAVRFLKYNRCPVYKLHAEAQRTPDLMSDSGISKISLRDQPTEESLFYSVPWGAMESYRKSVEFYVVECEKTINSMQKEADTSMHGTGGEVGYHESSSGKDVDTSTYYFSGVFESNKSIKSAQKKQKTSLEIYNARLIDSGGDRHYGFSTSGTQASMLMGKRSSGSMQVGSIPAKRLRTASRQRVMSPSGAGATGVVQVPAKTNAFSEGTSSFQADLSTLAGGSQIQRSVEVDSLEEFGQLPYDSAENSKLKKRKSNHLGSPVEQGWQLDLPLPNEQKDHSGKRLESRISHSNGMSDLYVPQLKKTKLTKQSIDNNFDNVSPTSGSISSPITSQMSNMSNPNRMIKLIGGRLRGRKAKVVKTSTEQSGSGSQWSMLEDQALVVLVHDMGPNWELISDAINNASLLKCIYRKPQECKERHKILMDMSPGDGVDSAEDSGSSQPYPSSLPGIPKGSARQLFQRLQGPMEEEMIKSHFEKIISIGKKLNGRKIQVKNDKQESKHIVAVHDSHIIAISQFCPNNSDGRPLMPLDFCNASGSDAEEPPPEYQDYHASNLSQPNQAAQPSLLPNSGDNSSSYGSSNIVSGSNLSLPSGILNPSAREGRHCVQKSSAVSIDEQKKMQQYNQMPSGRYISASSLSVPGPPSETDHGARSGMACRMTRNLAMPTLVCQGMASSSMLKSGSGLSSAMVGMPSAANMQSGGGTTTLGNLMRSHDPRQVTQPGVNSEHQRLVIVPEIQVTQGNSQGVSPFNGLSSIFPDQTVTSSVQSFHGHSLQQHQRPPQFHNSNLQGSIHSTESQQRACAIHLAKEEQPQQRYMQQQQFSTSTGLMPRIHSHDQLPLSPSVSISFWNSSQATSQAVSLPSLTSSSPMTRVSCEHQIKHLTSHGVNRNSQAGDPQTVAKGLSNQMRMQWQRQSQQHQQQQFQQPGRNHSRQRPHIQSQQPAKVSKRVGMGNMFVQQDISSDLSQLDGFSVAPGNVSTEKGQQVMHLTQGQGLYPQSGVNTAQQSKPSMTPQSLTRSQMLRKLYPGPTPSSSKQLQCIPSHSDNNTQNQVNSFSPGHIYPASSEGSLPTVVATRHPLHSQPHHKQVIQMQPTVQKALQQKCQRSFDPSTCSYDQARSNQLPLDSASPTGLSTATAHSSAESHNIPAVSSAIASQQNTSELKHDSKLPNPATQVSSTGCPPLMNSKGSELVQPLGQGSCQRRLSHRLHLHEQSVGAQRQPLPLVQQSPAPSLPPSRQHNQPQGQLVQHDQQQSPQQQLPPTQLPQMLTHLRSGKGSLHVRHVDSNLRQTKFS